MTDTSAPSTTETPAAPGEPSPPRGRSVLFYFGGLLLLVGAFVASMTLAATKKHAETVEADARHAELGAGPLVQVAQVEKAPPTRTVTLSGEVTAYRQATLYAKISGYLKMVRVDKGDRVRAGEVLGVMEAPEVEQEVASKQADLAIKKLTDARYNSLAASGIISQQDRERATADVNIASADLSRLNALRGYEVIRAPFDGVVTARHADPGALLQAATSTQGALPLVDVADLTRVRVYVHLAQSEALFVHEADPVLVWTDERPDQKVKATITRFSRDLDTRSRTMLTEIELDNREAGLYPGTFVRVRLELAAAPALAVPEDALAFRGGKTMAARVEGGKAKLVPVELGGTNGKTVRIVDGLREGDTVVLHPGDEVIDGAQIRVAPRPVASTGPPAGK